MTVDVTLLDDSVITLDMIPCNKVKARDGQVEYFIPKSQLMLLDTEGKHICTQHLPGELYHIDTMWLPNCSLREKAQIKTMSVKMKRAYRIAKALLFPSMHDYNTYMIKTAFLHIHHECGDRIEDSGFLLREIIRYLEERTGQELDDRRNILGTELPQREPPALHPFFNPLESLLHQRFYNDDAVDTLRLRFRNWITLSDAKGILALVDDLVRDRNDLINKASHRKCPRFNSAPLHAFMGTDAHRKSSTKSVPRDRHLEVASSGEIKTVSSNFKPGEVPSMEDRFFVGTYKF